jgi:hypothetical protein
MSYYNELNSISDNARKFVPAYEADRVELWGEELLLVELAA